MSSNTSSNHPVEIVIEELARGIRELRDSALMLGPTRKQVETIKSAERRALSAADLLSDWVKRRA